MRQFCILFLGNLGLKTPNKQTKKQTGSKAVLVPVGKSTAPLPAVLLEHVVFSCAALFLQFAAAWAVLAAVCHCFAAQGLGMGAWVLCWVPVAGYLG